jgi:acyl-CoA oxidase
MSKRIEGSLKNKIVASSLQEERDKCAFDRSEVTTMLFGGTEEEKLWDKYTGLIAKHPELANHHRFFEMTPDEKQ